MKMHRRADLLVVGLLIVLSIGQAIFGFVFIHFGTIDPLAKIEAFKVGQMINGILIFLFSFLLLFLRLKRNYIREWGFRGLRCECRLRRGRRAVAIHGP